jgi:alcohol dehydrogenase
MPYVPAFNREAAPRIARLAAYLGLAAPSFDAIIAWVIELRCEISVPHTIEGLGLSGIDVDRIAANGHSRSDRVRESGDTR